MIWSTILLWFYLWCYVLCDDLQLELFQRSMIFAMQQFAGSIRVGHRFLITGAITFLTEHQKHCEKFWTCFLAFFKFLSLQWLLNSLSFIVFLIWLSILLFGSLLLGCSFFFSAMLNFMIFWLTKTTQRSPWNGLSSPFWFKLTIQEPLRTQFFPVTNYWFWGGFCRSVSFQITVICFPFVSGQCFSCAMLSVLPGWGYYFLYMMFRKKPSCLAGS